MCGNCRQALSQLDAQLAFTWSKMGVRDELKDQLDWITLTFTDFLEALCRVSCGHGLWWRALGLMAVGAVFDSLRMQPRYPLMKTCAQLALRMLSSTSRRFGPGLSCGARRPATCSAKSNGTLLPSWRGCWST